MDNAFLVTDPIAAAISNDGNGMIISCSEEKLFSDSFSQIRDYIGPGLDYIFPTIANDYYLLIGRDYVALAFMSREESIIVWGDYSGYSEFVGFNREKSTFTILRGENESVTREILWNFETPTLKSRIVKWDSLDYFGPIIKRSSYF